MRYLSPKILILASLILTAGLTASAQDAPPSQEAGQILPQQARPNLLEALGLSPDQVRQIRLMNRDRRPLMEAAQRRLRETNLALDAAVYGDTLDEANVQAKLKELQDAQAEVARIRFQSELSLRKILTPEQLLKFRDLRAKAAGDRQNFRRRGNGPRGDRPLRRIRQLPRRPGVN